MNPVATLLEVRRGPRQVNKKDDACGCESDTHPCGTYSTDKHLAGLVVHKTVYSPLLFDHVVLTREPDRLVTEVFVY